jgi:hypothetical protein
MIVKSGVISMMGWDGFGRRVELFEGPLAFDLKCIIYKHFIIQNSYHFQSISS